MRAIYPGDTVMIEPGAGTGTGLRQATPMVHLAMQEVDDKEVGVVMDGEGDGLAEYGSPKQGAVQGKRRVMGKDQRAIRGRIPAPLLLLDSIALLLELAQDDDDSEGAEHADQREEKDAGVAVDADDRAGQRAGKEEGDIGRRQ